MGSTNHEWTHIPWARCALLICSVHLYGGVGAETWKIKGPCAVGYVILPIHTWQSDLLARGCKHHLSPPSQKIYHACSQNVLIPTCPIYVLGLQKVREHQRPVLLPKASAFVVSDPPTLPHRLMTISKRNNRRLDYHKYLRSTRVNILISLSSRWMTLCGMNVVHECFPFFSHAWKHRCNQFDNSANIESRLRTSHNPPSQLSSVQK